VAKAKPETTALPGMLSVFKCNRRGYFNKMCFSKTVAMVSKDTFNADNDVQTEPSQNYLDAISDDSDHSVTAWYIRAMVNNHEVVFKVDTGAEVTAISKEVYDAFGQPQLNKPTKVLSGPSRQPLDVLGHITVNLRYKNKAIKYPMYVCCTNIKSKIVGAPGHHSLKHTLYLQRLMLLTTSPVVSLTSSQNCSRG